MVDDQVCCDLPYTSQNDDKMANLAYQTKNIHSTVPVIKNTINKKTEAHANNQKCSQTKTNPKIQNQKIVFSKVKKMQSNENTGSKHKMVLLKSNEIDKLALKTMTAFHRSLDYICEA